MEKPGARHRIWSSPRDGDRPKAERRLVSVLFADLVGFTPFSEKRDPEEVRETPTGQVSAVVGADEPRLEIGNWEASGTASGHASAKRQGINILWVGQIPAEFKFSIADAGKAKGVWRHDGKARQIVSGKVQGITVYGEGNLRFRGQGKVGGNDRVLTLKTKTKQTGQATAKGVGVAIPLNATYALPTLKMKVLATNCDEAYGDWSFVVEQQFGRKGFRASFDGPWMGVRQTDETGGAIKALLRAVRAERSLPTTESPLLNMAADLIAQYNALVDSYPDWSSTEVWRLFADTERILTTSAT